MQLIPRLNHRSNITVFVVAILLICLSTLLMWRTDFLFRGKRPLISIDNHLPNYGTFIDNIDNNYYLTSDQNVKHILEAYIPSIMQPGKRPSAQDFAIKEVYYYDDSSFIIAEKSDPRDFTQAAYTMHSMEDLNDIGECVIFTDAGIYKDSDIMISGTFKNTDTVIKDGACVYEKGFQNFVFIDLSPQISQTETIFLDPLGQSPDVIIKDVDTRLRSFAISVYDMKRKDIQGNYVFERNVYVHY